MELYRVVILFGSALILWGVYWYETKDRSYLPPELMKIVECIEQQQDYCGGE
ncbi:hypothetical protein [uncultured Shewanella sp.]|uniref:hypothetical protein n=1 Tax=uncultured Shewanella sp. TaxID=173975 RepID=UPI0026188FE5|nr:hypothetical protein [uncultured Shewanella sp.]